MTQQAEPVQDAQPSRPTVVVRYGYLGWVGEFSCDGALRLEYGDKVVVKSDRGMEIGSPVAVGCRETCCKYVPPEQIDGYVKASGADYLSRGAGQVVRAATPEDLAEQRHIDDHLDEKIDFCQIAAGQVGLNVKVVACEHLLGGERIIFYFMADGRVDFRQLVRELAREYHTRIEMRQIGARDEARIVADVEICGRECCCKNFLKVLRPVNMKMAKMQKATLDPTKVSGRCGRLRCCLRYEQQTYEQLDANLPALGTRVKVEQGEGFVRERQVITQILVLDMGEGRRLGVPLDEVHEILSGPSAGDRPIERAKKAAPAPPDGDVDEDGYLPPRSSVDGDGGEATVRRAGAGGGTNGDGRPQGRTPRRQGGSGSRGRGERGRDGAEKTGSPSEGGGRRRDRGRGRRPGPGDAPAGQGQQGESPSAASAQVNTDKQASDAGGESAASGGPGGTAAPDGNGQQRSKRPGRRRGRRSRRGRSSRGRGDGGDTGGGAASGGGSGGGGTQ